jgi:nucleoid-associated protein YgaU
MKRPLITLAVAFFVAILGGGALIYMSQHWKERGSPTATVAAPGAPAAPGVSGATPGAAPEQQAAEAPSATPAGAAATTDVAQTPVPAAGQGPDSGQSPTTAAGEPTPDSVRLPAFDIVRVEPNGDAVIAGRGEPGSELEILSNGQVIAEATVDAEGAFLAIPEGRLPPGSHELTLRAVGADSAAAGASAPATVAVMVPGEPGQQVATAEQGAPSGSTATPSTSAATPTAPTADTPATAAPAEQQVAANTPATSAETPSASAAPAAPAATSEAPGSPIASTPAQPETPAPTELTAVLPPIQDGAAPGSATPRAAPAPGETGAPGAAAPEAPAASATGGQQPATTGAPATQLGTETAATTLPAAPGEATATAEATIPAPGSATPATGETPAASAAAGTGTEVATAELPAASETPAQPAAASDQTAAATAEQPATGTAEQPGAATSEPSVAAAEPSVAAAIPAEPAPATSATAPPLSIQAAESEAGSLYVAGEAPPGTRVRVFAGEDFIGEAQAGDEGNWLLEARAALPLGQVVISARAVEPNSNAVLAQVDMPFVRYADGVVLEPAILASGAGAGAATTANLPPPVSIIIRRGDNLWRISRRNYGRGIRYHSIFAANRDQIDNPHWIFPGQVFVVPTRDRSWEEAGASASLGGPASATQ